MFMKKEKDLLLDFYRNMVTIRNFELKIGKLFAAGRIPGFVHLYLGEEAIAVGVCTNLDSQDYITSNHRGHGHLISKGGDIKLMMAELFGKKTGYCKGKGGSMHIADVSIGILGANGIVGAGIPIATGAGLACKLKSKKVVSVCFFGDGAAARGTFHEAVNLASLWKLPVIYVCENNMYAVSCYIDNGIAGKSIASRAASYGIPGFTIDGNDVEVVYKTTKKAVLRARNGDGPSLIVANTWRHHGHFEGEQDTYRDPKENQKWLAKDPILRLSKKLIEKGYADKKTLDLIEIEVKVDIETAIEFADSSPEPNKEELFEDIFVV
jgi:pyruvate dehydrogenase E1 component alpha subunit